MVKWLLFLMLLPSVVLAAANDFRISDNSGNVLNINSDGTLPVTLTGGYSAADARSDTGWTRTGTNIYQTTLTDNVGVGTLTPSAELEVESTAANDLFLVSDNGPGDTTPFVIASDGNVSIGSAVPLAQLYVNNGASINSFRVDDVTGNDTTPFVITSSGMVGIGTTNATGQELYVYGGASGNGAIYLQGGSSSAVPLVWYFNETGTNVAKVEFRGSGDATPNTMRIGTSLAGATVRMLSGNANVTMLLDSNGNVGIGSVTPGMSLDVQGEIRVSGVSGSGKAVCVKSTGDFGVCGDAVGAGGTCTCS